MKIPFQSYGHQQGLTEHHSVSILHTFMYYFRAETNPSHVLIYIAAFQCYCAVVNVLSKQISD